MPKNQIKPQPEKDITFEVEFYRDHPVSLKEVCLPKLEDCFQHCSPELEMLKVAGINVSMVA